MICRDCGREFKASGRQKLCPACAPQRVANEPRTCPACGNPFIPRIKAQTYCSAKCRNRKNAAMQVGKRYTVRCTICGQEFQAGNKHALYCSGECRNQAARERNASSGPDREITELTIYLVHEYAAEGRKTPEISEILRRSAASAREALGRPLRPDQQRCLQEFMKERR